MCFWGLIKSVELEEALISEVRNLGKEIMETWASSEEFVLKKALEDSCEPHHSKKTLLANNLWKSRSSSFFGSVS